MTDTKENERMKTVFMGTPEFAVPALQRLVESEHEVALVVTQPDKRAGRGQKMKAPAVKEAAIAHGIEVMQPAKVRGDQGAELLERLRAIAPDVIVVVAYGKILPPEILEVPKICCLNIHASLLPRYRGAAPINWAIIDGNTETGVTIMKLDEGMDTGDIVRKETVAIFDDDDVRSLGDMLSVAGASALLDVLAEAETSGKIDGEKQEESMASHAPMLKKEDGRINWALPTERIICLIHGTTPWPGTFCKSSKGTLKVLQGEPLWPTACEEIDRPDELEPGTVALTLKTHGFAVRTGDGFLMVTQAQAEGKPPMSGVDLINGKWIKTGDRLS